MRSRALLLAPAVLMLAVGCGGGSSATPTSSSSPSASAASNGVQALPADQVLAKAKTAFAAAPSVRVRGDVTDGSDKIGLDLQLGAPGQSRATLKMAGTTIQLLVNGGDVYISGDDGFWNQAGGQAFVSLLHGKFLKTSTTDDKFKSLLAFSDRAELSKELLPGDGFTLVGPTSLNGRPVVQLKQDDGSYYVAATGQPYPVKLAGKDGTQTADLDFVEYGTPVQVSAPPAAQIVDVSKLKG